LPRGAVNDIEGGYDYPDVVRFEIEEQDLASYQRAADFLNIGNVDIVCIQHEFGIFGGPAGSHLLALLRELRMPVVTTFHTILSEPNGEQRRVMQELISRSTRLVVMADRGRRMLQEIYQAPPAKIDFIPHGIPDIPFVDPNYYKDQFGVEGRMVLLTFGLLSPNKGSRTSSMRSRRSWPSSPDVVYVVVGATHPNEFREQGEAYRISLERLAKKNKVDRNVIFYNRFVDIEELKEFIGAADLYITPYLNEAQITSGTLAYAFGAGKAVISTPYWYASELLGEDRGVLVPFNDPGAMARAVIGLLREDTRRHAMRKNAYKLGREMVWSETAKLYWRSFELARLEGAELSRKSFATKTLDQQPRDLPASKLDHLSRMTDSTGIFQHAVLTVPNFGEGYCTDDNARAFVLAVLLDEIEEDPVRFRTLATTYAAFLNHAFDPAAKRFHNLLSFDRRWLDTLGSEDCHGRALWALGLGAGRSRHYSFQVMAGQLFSRALPSVSEFTSPRAWAFALLGIHEYLGRMGGDRLVHQIRESPHGASHGPLRQVRAPGLAVVRGDADLRQRQARARADPERDGRWANPRSSRGGSIPCAGSSTCRPRRTATSARSGATASIREAAPELTSTSNRSRRRPWSPPASKRSARPPTPGGTSRPTGPSTGSSGGTISVSSSTPRTPAAAATPCTSIASTGTRAPSRRSRSCSRWPRCGSCRTPSPSSSSRRTSRARR
jgi:glycosyltransferase involved in cell wall biosynthesis